MGIKQALFLGGAVLVLAACGDATGPSTQMRQAGTPAAAKDKTAPTSTSNIDAGTTRLGVCLSGYVITSGFSDSTCASDDQ